MWMLLVLLGMVRTSVKFWTCWRSVAANASDSNSHDADADGAGHVAGAAGHAHNKPKMSITATLLPHDHIQATACIVRIGW